MTECLGVSRCGKLGIRKTVTVSSDELSRESRSPLAIGSPPPPPQVDKSPSPLPITAKPKSVAQLLSSRRMSSAIVSSLLSSSPQLELPGDKRQDQITVSSSESVLIFTEVVSLPLETADKVTTLALGPTHSVFATCEACVRSQTSLCVKCFYFLKLEADASLVVPTHLVS